MTWRSQLYAVVRHPSEPRVLMLRSDREWRLPRTLVPRAVWAADATTVVPALEQRLGTRIWFLRRLAWTEDKATQRIEGVCEVEPADDWDPPAHGRWVGRRELRRPPAARRGERRLLTDYLDTLERDDVPEERSPWARPGWVVDVRAWLEREVSKLGRSLRGIEQVKHWSISSVLRIETDGADLYFKVSAQLPLWVEEGSVTAMLAERFPGLVPVPLAVEPERGWMLLPAFDDVIGWYPPLDVHEELFRRFAGMQRRSAEITGELLADGCVDRRLDTLEARVDPLLGDSDAVHRLTPDEVAELRRLAPELKEACRRLAACGVPYALVHGDLHPGNVARLKGELAYFDWTDACIAHPFFDLQSLQWQRDEATRAALLAAYLGAWEGVESPERLREAAALAAIVTPLHHAVSYQQIVANLEPEARPELDATHEFLREILARARHWSNG